MINAQSIIDLSDGLADLISQIERKDTEGWTLEDCDEINDALGDLGIQTSILYIACMTEEEMANLEREGRDDG